MTWDYPLFTFFTLLLPLFGLFMFYRERRKQLRVRELIRADNLIRVSFRKVVVKRILFIMALFFMFLALASPRWGRLWQEVKKEGKSVIFVIDTSLSMLAEDMTPNRLAKAKEKVSFIIENLPGDKVGIVFFAGAAFLQSPVTFDREAVRLYFNEAWESLIPLPGSNIEEALRLSLKSFPDKGAENVVVLITDGEELQGQAEAAAAELRKENIGVAVIGMGKKAGAPVPVYRGGKLEDYKRDKKGETVISRLDEKLLSAIASETGGVYAEGEDGFSDCSRVISFLEKRGGDKTAKEKAFLNQEHRYQLPLSIALLFLVLEFMTNERKKDT